MTDYTFDDVQRVLHEIVAERPDYVYEYPEGADECTYTDKDGNPSCLIGQVISRLDPEELARIHESEWDVVEEEVWDDHEAIGWREVRKPVNILGVVELPWARQFEHIQRSALSYAQEKQDALHEWSYAEEAFLRRLEGDAD